ncbi:hypothetical protein B0H13DRAFT_1887076 [Mycena leptocephala]|nr:hypothetical protein B0H13DRAFT_1887076 [Mycena leptocephala]
MTCLVELTLKMDENGIIIRPGKVGTMHPTAKWDSAILTLRVYALFNHERVILWLLSLAGLGSLAVGVWLGSAADTAAPLPGSLCMLSHVSHRRRMGGRMVLSIFAAVDVANILSYYDHPRISSAIKPFLAGSLAWLAGALSAILTARLILNMREVADTNSMSVGDVASMEASTVEWNDIDGIPMEDTRGHVRN